MQAVGDADSDAAACEVAYYDALQLAQGGIVVIESASSVQRRKLVRDLFFKLDIDLALVCTSFASSYDFVPRQLVYHVFDEYVLMKLTRLMALQKKLRAARKHFMFVVVLDFADAKFDARPFLSSLQMACFVSKAQQLGILVIITRLQSLVPANQDLQDQSTASSFGVSLWKDSADIIRVQGDVCTVATRNKQNCKYMQDQRSQQAFDITAKHMLLFKSQHLFDSGLLLN